MIRKLFRREPPPWPEIPASEIRKRARVLVIDDDAEFFYLELFRRDGYTVEKWSDIEDLQKLESGHFDVVLLDIHGVGREQSSDQGLGILRHLKRVAPTQLIIAYSNADWPLKYKEFFDLADATLDKGADYVRFKETVDDLLAQRFSLGFYLDRMAAILNNAPVDQQRIRALASDAIRRRKPVQLERALGRAGVSKADISLALHVAQTAINILSLFAR